MPQHIVGVAGRMASGKGTVTKVLLEHYQAKRYGSSDGLRAVLDIFAVPQTRENLIALSTFLRTHYGEAIIAQQVLSIIERDNHPVAVFDGMRRFIDVETFRPLQNFSFIFVDATQHTRYPRYIQRNENPGDAEMTLEQFQEKDSAEPEQQIDNLKPLADYVIDNNGSFEQFQHQLDRIVQHILKTQ